MFTDGIPATGVVFVENSLPLYVPTAFVVIGPRARRSIGFPIPDVVDLFTGKGLFVDLLPPSLSRTPPFLPQRLVRLLQIEEYLRTLHDGDEEGAGITIGCLSISGYTS